ncbi:MAG TPA: hypothetical protein LFW21_04160 [Rickettsia endosymbiont of Pyrocoelia pectoralis]|nr:hypothetical protein [Rickettsia endosymbiont of Pyrocoelia pectoralis]
MSPSFTHNSKTIEENINQFLETHNIDPTNALIPELSRYIALTHNSTNKERLEKVTITYNQTIERIIPRLEGHSEEFFSLMDKLTEGHSHKERFNTVNKKYVPESAPEMPEQKIPEQEAQIIIDNLKELLEDVTVVSGFKQSDHYKEFAEKINDIITTYNDSKLNSDIAREHKASPLPIIKAKLTELDKWCEETAKKDNSQVFKNIGRVIKHSIKGVVNLIAGDTKAFKTEQANVRLYMDGIKNANKNTIEATRKVKSFVEQYLSSKNQSTREQSTRGR